MFKKTRTIVGILIVICILTGLSFFILPAETKAAETNIDNFLQSKYGIFSTYAYGDAYDVTQEYGGGYPDDIDDLADNFDAEQYAADVASWGMEYVIFSAWHCSMNVLYPSTVMNTWRTGQHCTTTTDVIGDLIDALEPYGIDLYLYTHPADGMDFSVADQTSCGWNDPTDDYETWNDFINDAYDELLTRYGDDIKGILFDSVFPAQVDRERLRDTVDSFSTDYALISLANAPQVTDYNCKELNGDSEGPLWYVEYTPIGDPDDVDTWWGYNRMQASVTSTTWWAYNGSVRYTEEEMYLETVVEAATNTQGGGMAWSFGPFPGETLWETGIESTFDDLWDLIEPVEESIRGTLRSESFPTEESERIGDLDYVATQSSDGEYEYIHVLNPPAGSTIDLPWPVDCKEFYDGELLSNGHDVTVIQDSSGVHITLKSPDTWDSLDTVIKLYALQQNTVNVAIDKTATANAGDGSKAVDGNPNQAYGWYDPTGPQTLVVDLGDRYSVTQFVLKHAGSWGGDDGYNTEDYKIQVSDSSSGPWVDVITMDGNTDEVTVHDVDINGRYFRLYITDPSNNTDTASRIYEFEIRSPVSSVGNLALNKTTTTNGGDGSGAVDGIIDAYHGWYASGSLPQTLVVDLGKDYTINSFLVYNSSSVGQSAAYNTEDYKIQVSDSSSGPWTDVVTVDGNTDGLNTFSINPVTYRYVRLYITDPSNNEDTHARIYEFKINGYELPIIETNIALDKGTTTNGGDGSKTVDGSAAEPDGWYGTANPPQTLVIDLGGNYVMSEFKLYHASSWGGSAAYNTADYQIQISDSPTGSWTDVVTVDDNTDGITDHNIDPVVARYVRLYITDPSNNEDTHCRIYEFEIF